MSFAIPAVLAVGIHTATGYQNRGFDTSFSRALPKVLIARGPFSLLARFALCGGVTASGPHGSGACLLCFVLRDQGPQPRDVRLRWRRALGAAHHCRCPQNSSAESCRRVAQLCSGFSLRSSAPPGAAVCLLTGGQGEVRCCWRSVTTLRTNRNLAAGVGDETLCVYTAASCWTSVIWVSRGLKGESSVA